MRNSAKPTVAAILVLAAACSRPSAPAAAPAAQRAATTPTPTRPGSRSVEARRKALDALLHEHWEWVLRTYPEFASVLGDTRYNDRWNDESVEAVMANLEQTRRFLTRFEAIDTTGFPDQEVLNQQLMVRAMREQLEGARFEGWLMPVDQKGGFYLDFPQLVPLLRFATVKDYDDYIVRLRTAPRVFDQVLDLMRAGMAKKLMKPRFLLERAVDQADKLARAKPEVTPFAEPVAKFPDAIPVAERKRLRAEVLAAIHEQVLPSYVQFTAFLRDEYAPHGRTEVGEWSLPDGEARYAFDILAQTTTTMNPDDIHEIGLREVARIESEEEAIGKKLGFPDLASFRKHIRANHGLYARSRQDILDRYQKYTDRMVERLPTLFGRMPRQKMIILPVERFREKDASGAAYTPGTQDGSRPGMVRVNTGDATRRLTMDMESTAYHEGVPGHHMQLALQQELPELPPFRQHGGYTAFHEGWALYAERLGKEVGLYEDPYSDYGRLEAEMLRAIRLVVDTGLHSKRWTREQVVKYMHDHSTTSEPDVQSETNRYIVWPAQALAYKIGEMTITRLREKARAELAGAFDIRAFHDEVLGAGALPLDVLEARIDAWIARARRGPP